ncbi:hypothetical protein [Gordonia aichiensis]|uniref:hypothetical protein n=1 Tax=Gordonia aichiensis TaxID=36820 RepID=UPI0032653835
MSALSGPDAAMYWRSLVGRNDQFLVYAFAATAASVGDPMAELRRRAAGIADLHLAIARVPGDLDYPRWCARPAADDQFRRSDAQTWDEVLADLATLMAADDAGPGSLRESGALPESGSLWRVHLHPSLVGVPGTDGGRAHVVVLQISHALGDGRTVSAIARRLLSDTGAIGDAPAPGPPPGLRTALRGALTTPLRLATAIAVGTAAWRADSTTAALTATAPTAPIEPTELNRPGSGPIRLQTITVDRESVRRPGMTVTVGALVRIAEVLPEFGGASADGRTVAEVTLARPGSGGERNSFFTAGIDLRSDLGRDQRATVLADALAEARRRDALPGRSAARRATAWAPAIVESWGVRLAAAAPVPPLVAGATVVSSVDRGPADLTLAGGQVLFTAGFPALSPVHGLTHGVHGIGETVTVSVAARGAAAETIDDYAAALRAALTS